MPNPVSRVVEVITPARLGRGFRWLFAAMVANNIGDGVVLAAGPLLVASLTRDPFLVSLAVLMVDLPILLFALIGGVAADRWDRRRMVIIANLGRAFVVAVLVATIVTGSVTIGIVLITLFVLGVSETFADSASSTFIPNLVAREDLGLANSRKQGALLLTNQLLMPPVGALLFAISPPIPFAVNAICFLLGALLISRVVVGRREVRTGMTTVRADLVEGIRWLVHHPPMRTLAITIFAFNVTFGAAWSVLVLYAQERLGMGDVGFGLLTTAMAIGGLAGTAAYTRLERRFSLADIMRGGLVIETLTHLSLAITTSPAWALGTFVVFGAHAFVWGTTSEVVKQRAVPDAVLGRVGGVYRIAIVGGMVIGAPIGGLLARWFGITAPFWFGFIGSVILLLALWRQFDNIVHAGDIVPHATTSGTS
jgi:MFS family permease